MLFLWLVPLCGWAQQEISPALYLLEPYRYNSACSGFSSGMNLSLSYANQWVGWEGAPSEIALTLHQLLRETQFSMGGMLSVERSGINKVMEGEIAGTYRFLLTDWTWLSLSVGGGVRVVGKDFSLLDQDGDSYYEQQDRREVVPRFRMGAWLRFEDGSYCAFSLKGVGLGHTNAFGHKQSTHFYWSGEKAFRFRSRYHFVLNGMMTVAKYAPFAFLLTPSVRSDQWWELGLSLHSGGSFSPFVKLSFRERLTIGCCYSYSLLRSAGVGDGSSFSLLLNYRICSQQKGRERLFRNAPL